MVTRPAAPYAFDLSGGRLCLDFANTVSDRASAEPVDHLRTYEDLMSWATQAGALRPPVARALRADAEAHPSDARRALADAIAVREGLYRLFAAVAARRRPRAADLEVLNAHVPSAFVASRVEPSARGG